MFIFSEHPPPPPKKNVLKFKILNPPKNGPNLRIYGNIRVPSPPPPPPGRKIYLATYVWDSQSRRNMIFNFIYKLIDGVVSMTKDVLIEDASSR